MSAFTKYLMALLLSLLVVQVQAQLWFQSDRGLNIGFVSALGNRFQRLGITLQGYYCYGHVQGNAEVRFYRNFRNLGPLKKYNELVTSAGVVVGYGGINTLHNPFLSSISNQTGYRSSVGYSYNLYFNRIKTTQQTGTLALQFRDVSIITENDLLARPELDRFRTGAILVQYQHRDQLQLALNCTMWTGQMGDHRILVSNGFFPYGYMDTTDGRYTQYSHGLLSAQAKANLRYGQVAQADVGVDAEQVRNFVQNRLIHDMAFLPKKWHNPRNCHLPMVDTAGNPYLHLPGQKVKRVTPYWNVFTSPSIFY